MLSNEQIITIVVNVLNVGLVIINAYFLKRNHSKLATILENLPIPELVNSSLKK